MITECELVREEFSAFLDEELGADARLTVENHLCDCSDCLRALDGYKKTSDLYATLPLKGAPVEFDVQLMADLRPADSFSLSDFLERHRAAVLAAGILCCSVVLLIAITIAIRALT